LYPNGYNIKVHENQLSTRFCGAFRPGHFDGVLSVVMKLLNIIKPHRAYFGEKDYQQLRLIEEMVVAYFLETQIVRVKTVRDSTGFALSSRNQLLTQDQILLAQRLNQVLLKAKSAHEAENQLTDFGFKVDYVEDWDGRRLAAATLGSVRLIDNVELK
ncbi:MAG: pantoate--beta-alanine ligase, partial [Oligoflexia bacterium]|nr:pantoate--beta-alanine ligase [Oligoflexia bacterium]